MPASYNIETSFLRCQHNMPAYYASILQYRNVFSKMLAYTSFLKSCHSIPFWELLAELWWQQNICVILMSYKTIKPAQLRERLSARLMQHFKHHTQSQSYKIGKLFQLVLLFVAKLFSFFSLFLFRPIRNAFRNKTSQELRNCPS